MCRSVLHTSTSTCCMQNGVLFSLYVNDMPTYSRHVELVLYTEDMAILATSSQPALLVIYLGTYLSDIGRCLGEWRITYLSSSTVMLFAKTRRRISKPRPIQLFGQQIYWVDTARYLGVTLDLRFTWSIHIDQIKKKLHRLGVLGTLINSRNDLTIRNSVLLYKQLIQTVIDYASPIWRFAAPTHVR